MKQVFLLILGTAVFITLVGLYTTGKFSPQPVATKEVTINTTVITVEIADTPTKRSKGLSGKASLNDNSGMLFILDAKEPEPVFWMKGMLIPLDIVWIKDGKITKIDANVPAPTKDTADKDLKLYKPNGPVDYVLEVNAGFCSKNNITKGNSVQN